MAMDIVSVILAVVFVCILCLYLCKDKWRKSYPRGPWGLPLIGHLSFLDKYPAKTFQRWSQTYGPVFRIRMGSWNTIVLNGYGAIKTAAEFEDDVFSDRFNFASFNLQKDLNDGIYTITSSPFNQTLVEGRKITSKAIGSLTRLHSPVFKDIIFTSVQSFCTSVMSKGNNTTFNLEACIDKAVGTIVYKVIYGRGHDDARTEKQIETIANQWKETSDVMGCGSPADVLPWFKYFIPAKMAAMTEVFSKFQQVGNEEIKIHKQTFSEDQSADVTDLVISYERKKTGKNDPVSLLLYSGLKELFGAGFETSSTTLKWLFLYMIAYPDIQAKVQAEIDEVVGSARVVSLEDKDKLHYTVAVINEVMRMTSIVPFAIPHRARKDAKFMGYDVDEGTYVIFNLHSINYEISYWGDPEVFRPERLLDENGHIDKQKCSRVVPFGLGRRRCVGERLARMQVFILFAALMQRCTLEKPDGDVIDLMPIPALTYAPKPYRVTVKDRQNAN